MLNKGLSVVVTYYKGKDFIFKCLDSIFNSHELSAKKLPFEIILIIDSIDDAEFIANQLTSHYGAKPIRIFKNEENIGVSASRNFGLSKISYRFYTIIDQDDYVKENYFSVLEGELEDKLAVHIINGMILQNETNKQAPMYFFKPHFNFKSIILRRTVFYTPGLLIFNVEFISPRDLFIDASAQYKGCDDWGAYINLSIDLKDQISQKFIASILFVYCLHTSNYSQNLNSMLCSGIAVLSYMKNKPAITKAVKSEIAKATRMHEFYYKRDVERVGKWVAFLNFPDCFLSHYIFSFFNKERFNRLVFRIRFALS